MADISIQFHATPDELLAFAKQVVADYALHVVAMRYSPFEAIEVGPSELDAVLSVTSAHRELAFTLVPPLLAVTSNTDFFDKNPSKLRLDVGRQEAHGLRESWLTTRTKDPVALRVWKEIAKRLRGMTEQGATAVNPSTGVTGPARGHRFTAGAKALEAGGVPMLTNTGILLKPGMPVTRDRNGGVADKQ